VETVLRRETGYSRINNSDPPPQAIWLIRIFGAIGCSFSRPLVSDDPPNPGPQFF
jgi:hypothetical protein